MTLLTGRGLSAVRSGGFVPTWVPRGDNKNPAVIAANFDTAHYWHQGPRADYAELKTTSGTTFTRTTVKDYLNSSSAITSSAINTEAFETMPSGAVGISMEPSRTNLLSYNKTLSNAFWVKDEMTATASGDWWQVRETATPDTYHRIRMTSTPITIVSGTTYTTSIIVRKAGRRYLYIRMLMNGLNRNVGFDLDTVTSVSSAPSSLDGRIKSLGSNMYLLEVSYTSTNTTYSFAGLGTATAMVTDVNIFNFVGAGDPAQGVDILSFQAEAGSAATSHITTTTAAVTRGQDVMTVGPLTLGSELIVPANWILGTAGGTSVATNSPTGTINITGDGTNAAYADISMSTTVGKTYSIKFTPNTGSSATQVGTTQGGAEILGFSAAGGGFANERTFTATATTTWLRLTRTAAGTCVFTSITAKEATPFAGYNQTNGAFIWEGDMTRYGISQDEALFVLDDGTVNNRILAYVAAGATTGGTITFVITTGNVAQASITTSFAPYANIRFRIMAIWANNQVELWINGTKIGSTDTSATIPQVNTLRLGRGTVTPAMNGHIAKWAYLDTSAFARAAVLSTVGGV